MRPEFPYSRHSFMLPIRWDYLGKKYNKLKGKEELTFDDKTNLNVINSMLLEGGWERQFFRLDQDPVAYNELSYFHAYATGTLYDLQQHDEQDVCSVASKKIVLYYTLSPKSGSESYYKIKTLSNTYQLDLSSISLHVFTTGICILVFNLDNFTHPATEEILAINEYGRRIYPQFLGDAGTYVEQTKQVFLADTIEIQIVTANRSFVATESFEAYLDLRKSETHGFDGDIYQFRSVVRFPAFVKNLFPAQFCFTANDEAPDTIRLNLLGDDRMFFLCWYGNDLVAKEIADELKASEKLLIKNKFWYAFLNGDKDAEWPSAANRQFIHNEIEKATYSRWAEYGTLYGFTRDSFVAISSTSGTLRRNLAPDLRIHMMSLYYQMAVLNLCQRASVLRFGAEIAAIHNLERSQRQKDTSERINNLYLNYIDFINRIYFREVTPQIQGIEIYNQFQQAMGIERDVESLKHEFQELHNFAMMLRQDEQNKTINLLTWIGGLSVPTSIMFSILGSNYLTDIDWRVYPGSVPTFVWFWTAIGLSPTIVFLIVFFIYNKLKAK